MAKINDNRKRKKLTKAEIIDYYYALAYPDQAPGGPIPVPVEMKMRAFDKLLQWQGITPPATVVDEAKPSRFIIEIKSE